MSGPAVVIVVPVLGRPHNVGPLVASLREVTAETTARLLFVATRGDDEEIAEIQRLGQDLLVVPPRARGDYAHKINTGYRQSTEPFLLLGADDIRFRSGWWEAALPHFDDPKIGVVGTNDLGNARVISGEHATHSIVRRSYVDEFGTIDESGKVLHEGYPHEFVDDEFVETARLRGAFVSEPTSIVEHFHPLWRKAPTDRLYDGQARRMRAGRGLYNRRRRLWTARR